MQLQAQWEGESGRRHEIAPITPAYFDNKSLKAAEPYLRMIAAMADLYYIAKAKGEKWTGLTPRDLGSHGLSELHRSLPYLKLSTFFMQPLDHAILFGVVEDFLTYIFQRHKDYFASDEGKVWLSRDRKGERPARPLPPDVLPPTKRLRSTTLSCARVRWSGPPLQSLTTGVYVWCC